MIVCLWSHVKGFFSFFSHTCEHWIPYSTMMTCSRHRLHLFLTLLFPGFVSGAGEIEIQAQGENLILAMGLVRSGSTAIHQFIECNLGTGHSAHYCCHNSERKKFPCDRQTCGACVHTNLNQSRPAFQGCGSYTAFSQWDVETADPFAWFIPQHFALPLIHEHYPQSTWILNVRETPARWADSVLHWYSIANRVMQSFGHQYHDGVKPGLGFDREMASSDLYQALESSILRAGDPVQHERRRQVLIEIYREHTAKVLEFAARYGHGLLVLNVDSPTAGRDLSTFLKGKWKEKCWKFDGSALDIDWKDFTLQVYG